MYHKSETFEKFKEFRAEAEKQLDKNIKFSQFDRIREYLSTEFIGHLLKNEIFNNSKKGFLPLKT